MDKKLKVFGAALDAIDDPLKVRIKQAYLSRLSQNLIDPKTNFLDPYEGLLASSRELARDKYIKIGKFPVESWLTPKPDLEDWVLLDEIEFRTFVNCGAVKEYSDEIEKFVQNKILPDIPIMIGADHSLTGGVLRSLSKKYGADKILIVIFDSHYDGIPASLRHALAKYSKEHNDEFKPIIPEILESVGEKYDLRDNYTCGSFLHYLLQEKISAQV